MLVRSERSDHKVETCGLDRGMPDCSDASRTPRPGVAWAELLKAYEAGAARKFAVMGAD